MKKCGYCLKESPKFQCVNVKKVDIVQNNVKKMIGINIKIFAPL